MRALVNPAGVVEATGIFTRIPAGYELVEIDEALAFALSQRGNTVRDGKGWKSVIVPELPRTTPPEVAIAKDTTRGVNERFAAIMKLLGF